MSPDDPRHGTARGESAHRRDREPVCPPCQEAKRRATIVARLHPPKVAAIGSRRRIQALQAIGYGRPEIARRLGYSDCGSISRLMKPTTQTVMKKTAARIAAVYEQLCMVPATGPGASRARGWARRHGYAPPLAWDDIDTDPEPNWGGNDTDVDPVVVMRLLEGDRIPSTKAEKDAAMEQWVADGGSKAELCSWHGWKTGRYGRPALRVIEGGAS